MSELSTHCVHLNTVYFSFVRDNSAVVIAYDRKSGDGDVHSSFMERYQFVVKLNDSRLSSYGVISVINHLTRLKIAIIVLQYDTGEVTAHICNPHLTESKSFETDLNFNLFSSKAHVSVADGPLFLFLQNKVVTAIFPFLDQLKVYDLTSFFPYEIHRSKILQFTCYDNSKMITSESFRQYVFAIFMYSVEDDKIFVFTIIQYLITNAMNEAIFNIPLTIFFPPYYNKENISALRVNILNDLVVKHHDDLIVNEKCENDTFLCCNKKLIIFHNGLIKYVCNIPFEEEVNYFHIFGDRNYSLENGNFIFQNESGICCAKLNEHGRLECSQVWKDVKSILCGDFQRNGRKGLLLLYSTDFSNWQEDCNLVQLSSFFHTSSSQSSEIPDEHLKTTVDALQQKIIVTKANIAEAECQIAQKYAVMQDVLHTIHNSSKDRSDGCSHKSLVDIITYKDEEQNFKTKEIETRELALTVKDQWNITFQKFWAVGWTLKNVSQSCVTRVNIRLVIEDCTLDYRQRVFIHNSRDLCMSKAEQQNICPGEFLSIVASMELPAFTQDSVTLLCIVSWDIGLETDISDAAFFFEDINHPYQELRTQFRLSIPEMLYKNKEYPTLYQILSFRTLQECILLSITTVSSDLSTFKKRLSHPIKQIWTATLISSGVFEGAYFEDEKSPLFGISFEWNQLNMTYLELEAYIRDESEAMLFIQWLYDILPYDTAIILKECTKKEESVLRKKLIASMKDELDLIKTTLISATAEHTSVQTGPSDIVIPRDLYFKMRKSLLKHECVTDSVMRTLSLC